MLKEPLLHSALKSHILISLTAPNADSKSYGLLEYDIQLEDRSHAVVFGQGRRKKRGATASLNQLWPDGKVYYTLHSSIGKICFRFLALS